jgi:pimeloyl-ACP methyl ester carboxylesterase
MTAAQAIQFRATESRGDYTAVRGWVVRETLLAVAALGFLTCSCLMLKRPDLFGRGRLPPRLIKTVVVLSALLGWRTLVWRPLIGKTARHAAYLLKGYRISYPLALALPQREDPDPAWDEEPAGRIRSLDGTQVHARLLQGDDNRSRSGHVIMLCAPNGGTAEQLIEPYELTALRTAGYSLLLFHPPQYGETGGTRTPQSDLLAAEACLHYLIADRAAGGAGFAEGNIHLVGWSIGSGAAIELMSRYELGESLLLVPFARLRTVMERLLGSGPLGRLLSWAARGAVTDWIEYNSVERMGALRCRNVRIIQAENDRLMGREAPREGDALRDSWCRSHRLDPASVRPTASGLQLFQGDKAQLMFESRVGLEHDFNSVPFMEQVFIPVRS